LDCVLVSEEKKEEEETKTDDSKKPSAPKTFDSEDSEDANPPKKGIFLLL